MLDTLGSIIAKILLKKYLGDEAAQIGGGVVDILKGRIKARLERTKTKNVAEEISEEIVERLEGLSRKSTYRVSTPRLLLMSLEKRSKLSRSSRCS